MASIARNRTRVILHVDLDAFYCKSLTPVAKHHAWECLRCPFSSSMPAGQVEMKRVGIPAHVPCAVQQWEGLIAGALPMRS